jgi:transposase
MNDSRKHQSKQETLRRHCCLNPHPHTVRDGLFSSDDFFDPCDLPQVKYEMLRRVVHDKSPVSKSASDFGFSRVSFYQARDAFENEGVSGLLPRKRGPKNRHKLTGEVMHFIIEAREREEMMGPISLAQRIKERFGIRIHPRSIQRAVAAQKKKLPERHGKTGEAD